VQNRCLLSKWLFKLINEEGVWQDLLRRKYVQDGTIAQVQRKPGDSHLWSGLMKVKEYFLNLGLFQLCNGKTVRFWKDMWVKNFSLNELYPILFAITRKKHISVASVFSTVPLNISFRRGLLGHNLTYWHNLLAWVANTRLTDSDDKFI
jgi:hypothetical protein